MIKKFFLTLIRVYQIAISPLLPPACRFYPCCSEYGREAVEKHGAFKGAMLTAWRLMRCQPLANGGFDPVPPVSELDSNSATQKN